MSGCTCACRQLQAVNSSPQCCSHFLPDFCTLAGRGRTCQGGGAGPFGGSLAQGALPGHACGAQACGSGPGLGRTSRCFVFLFELVVVVVVALARAPCDTRVWHMRPMLAAVCCRQTSLSCPTPLHRHPSSPISPSPRLHIPRSVHETWALLCSGHVPTQQASAH